MFHDFLWLLLGAVILGAIVGLWFIVYYLLNPNIKDPDGHAKITGKCGDTMEISLKFEDGKVVETSCWTDGCAHSYNSVCAAADLAKGKTPDEILEIDATCISEYVGGLPADHLHCAQLAEETLQAAVHHYMIKMSKRRTPTHEKRSTYCIDT